MRVLARLFGALALLALVLLLPPGEPCARAEEEGTETAPRSWIYDVRVVRVDAAGAAVLDAPPDWQPNGSEGATVYRTWADLLAGLRARGSTTILLDQRVTALQGMAAEVVQQQIRPVEVFERKDSNNQTWRAGTVETGAKGTLMATPESLQYSLEVRWEQPVGDGPGAQGLAAWKGTYPNFGTGETLVLSHRQQTPGTGAAGIEIYFFVTGWLVPRK